MPRVHAIRITLQRHWAIAEVRQEKSRGSLIILNDILFREFARWIQDLVRIGYSNILLRTRLAANHDLGELSANVLRKVTSPIFKRINSSRIASSDNVSSMLPSNASTCRRTSGFVPRLAKTSCAFSLKAIRR